MRILMISDVYYPRINGVSTSIRTFVKGLRAQGHEVTLIAPQYAAGEDDEPDILRVPARYLPFDPEDRLMKGGDFRRIAASLRTGGFDIMHVQTPFSAHREGVRLAKLLDIPVVESYHTHFEDYFQLYLPFMPGAWLRRLARVIARRQSRKVDAFIVPSEPMRGYLRDIGVAIPMVVIPTGIPLAEFRGGDRARFRAAHGIPEARPVLLFVGRVAHEKNIDFLLEVVARLRSTAADILLIIAGEGPAERHLRKRIDALGLRDNVLMLGYLSRADGLLDCYRGADVFVFASKTETQGLVLLEAMAAQIPVVTISFLGTRDILDAGRGALVARDELADFTAKVRQLLEDRGLRERLARDGRAYVEEAWSDASSTVRLIAFYQQAIAGRRNAHTARTH